VAWLDAADDHLDDAWHYRPKTDPGTVQAISQALRQDVAGNTHHRAETNELQREAKRQCARSAASSAQAAMPRAL
jgi:hypothetical protein